MNDFGMILFFRRSRTFLSNVCDNSEKSENEQITANCANDFGGNEI